MIQKRPMRRKAAIAMPLLLLACQPDPPAPEVTRAEALDLECAVAGAEFVRDVTVETGLGERPDLITVRHPDGGFRRLLLRADGTIEAADGAEQASLAALPDGRVEVAIGRDRYRLRSPSP